MNTPNAAQIAHVSLIRSPSVTHAFDMNQRFQFLNFTAGAGKVTVTAPANANLAPPGDYLLFLVDTNGVPSVGSFIRENPAPLSGDTTPPTVSVTAPASGQRQRDDPRHCERRRQRRRRWACSSGSTARISAPRTRRRRTRSPGTRRRRRTARTRSPPSRATRPRNAATSASVPVTVANTGPPPGVVAAYGFDTGSGTAVTDGSGNGNNGTLTNATWAGATAGRFGNALSFNGDERLGQHPRLELARPDDGHDDRGVGQPDGARQHVAHRRAEGAARLLRLRHVREHGGRHVRPERQRR